MFLVIAGAFVLLMQLGFAFLEGGCVRYKSLQSIMIKVMANAFVCVVMWWLVMIWIYI
jgi:Amt family ammonium transporter